MNEITNMYVSSTRTIQNNCLMRYSYSQQTSGVTVTRG